MVKLQITGTCEGCRNIDLNCDWLETLDGSRVYQVRCIHDEICIKLAGEEAALDIQNQNRDEASKRK